MPLSIKPVKVINLKLVKREKKPDGGYGIAHIQRGRAEVKHLTKLSYAEPLTMKADAYLENKAHFNLTLCFQVSG